MKLTILLLLVYQGMSAQVKLSGVVREKNTGEHIPYVNIVVKDVTGGTNANVYGFYSIEIPRSQQLEISYTSIGFAPYVLLISSASDSVIDIDMEVRIKELGEVTIYAKEDQIASNGNGHFQLAMTVVDQAPALLGEKDVLKTLQFLPGIQRSTEGSSALYVRGGSPDQNLILLDGAPVYNTNHLFGFLSIFNGDAIKSLDFWKSGFPSRFGGRISSVVDIQMKDGNREKISGKGGIGILSSHLTIEGPLLKKKSSFLIAARRSYLDLLTLPFMTNQNKQTYNFFDLNAKVNFDLGQKDRLILSGYFGADRLLSKVKEPLSRVGGSLTDLESDSRLGWGNSTLTGRWNHIFNSKLFLNTSFIYSGFNFHLEDEVQRTGAQNTYEFTSYRSSIKDITVKGDVDYFLNNTHTVRAGLLMTYHWYQPKVYKEIGSTDSLSSNSLVTYQNQEFGFYLEDNWRPVDKLKLDYGFRVSALNSGYHFYNFLEPRASISYEPVSRLILNGSYTRANQFVHLLSNTGIGLSTDLWVPVTEKAPPQQSDQFSLGLIKQLPNHGLSITVETFRKYMRNIIAYSEGATFQELTESAKDLNWENNITTGKGLSYGSEFLLEKKSGKLTGWLGYTLSWVVHQFDSLNGGNKFFPKYDSRHNMSTLLSYKFSEKISFSLGWVFGTGNAFTVPQGFYPTNTISFNQNVLINNIVPYVGSRNSFRGDPYHRLDIAFKLYKKRKRFERYWEFGLFNAYNRQNVLYYHIQSTYSPNQKATIVELKKRYSFPIIPSVSYNFKF